MRFTYALAVRLTYEAPLDSGLCSISVRGLPYSSTREGALRKHCNSVCKVSITTLVEQLKTDPLHTFAHSSCHLFPFPFSSSPRNRYHRVNHNMNSSSTFLLAYGISSHGPLLMPLPSTPAHALARPHKSLRVSPLSGARTILLFSSCPIMHQQNGNLPRATRLVPLVPLVL